jgi:uncharacterized protein (DUF697 family)
MFKRKNKDAELALLPVSSEDIERVRERCRGLVRKRAAISAGVSVIPVPGVDIVADLSSFAVMVEEINRAFGLSPEQIDRLQPRMRIAAYQAVAAIGSTLVGKIVTKELVLKVLQKSGAKLAAKSAAKIVPLAGQVASAAIGFALFRQMGYQHIDPCPGVGRVVAAARVLFAGAAERWSQASGRTTLTSSTSRLPWRSREILMSSALTLVYLEITSISSRCRAGRKSGPPRPLRSRAMMICSLSLAAVALF